MRFLLTAILLLFAAQAEQQMVLPKVEHKKETHTVEDDTVTVTCPEGYEGHFVDWRIGFAEDYWWNNGSGFTLNSNALFAGEQGYTVCFKKKFMDEVRKNPELLRARPEPPRPI